jgi:hypothetical protein
MVATCCVVNISYSRRKPRPSGRGVFKDRRFCSSPRWRWMTRGTGPGSFLTPARGALEGQARAPPRPKRTPPFRAGRRSAHLRAVLWSRSSAASTSLGLRRGGWGACGRGGASLRREDHLHQTVSEIRGAEVAKRPRVSRPSGPLWRLLVTALHTTGGYLGRTCRRSPSPPM